METSTTSEEQKLFNCNHGNRTNCNTGSELGAILHSVYMLLTGVSSSLSILGASATILVFILIPELRRKKNHLIVFLCIADGLTACGNMLGIIWVAKEALLGTPYCVFHSALTNYSSAASYLWNMCISLHLYICLVHNHQTRAAQLRHLGHAICWILPACIVGTAMFHHALGEDKHTKNPSWCWISSEMSAYQTMWQLICVKGWEVLAVVWIIVFYALIIVFLTKQRRALKRTAKSLGGSSVIQPAPRLSSLELINGANRKLLLVPLAFFFLRIWGTIRFLINTFDKTRTLGYVTMWLAPIQGVGDSGQGFANFVLYCILPGSVRHHLCASFRCLKRSDNNVLPIHHSSS